MQKRDVRPLKKASIPSNFIIFQRTDTIRSLFLRESIIWNLVNTTSQGFRHIEENAEDKVVINKVSQNVSVFMLWERKYMLRMFS